MDKAEKIQVLKRRIVDAFRSTQYPEPTNLLDFDGSHCEDCAEDYNWYTNAFAGKHWKELSFDMLDTYSHAVQSFTLEAFHFYLPAYLLVLINDPESEAADCVLRMLKPPEPWEETAAKESFSRMIGSLTEAQKSVVASCVWFLQEEYSSNFHEKWMQWMTDFWTPCKTAS